MTFPRISARLLAGVAASALTLGLVAPAAGAADIAPPVTVTASPAALTYAAVGTGVELSAQAEDGTGAAVSVEAWQFSSDEAGPYADIAGTTGQATLSLASVGLGDDGWYRAAFPDGAGGRVLSSAGRIDVGQAPSVTTPSGPTAVPVGQAFSLSVDVSGDEPVALVWESGPSNSGPWSAIDGATSNPQQITAPATAGVTTYYRVVATSPWGSSTSGAKSTLSYEGPTPPTAAAATNPAPGTLVVSWTGGGATGVSSTFFVEALRVESSEVFTQRVTSSPATFSGLPAGSYQARVRTETPVGNSEWTSAPATAVAALVQTGTLSATTLRPFKDGYQDTITLKATSNFPSSGAVRILNGSGTLVRKFTLSTATSWSIVFDGTTASGSKLAYGSYTAQFVLGGAVVATRAFTIASSQVGYPTASWSYTTFYPATDGYRDTAVLTSRTTIPATVTIVIVNSSGQKVYSKSLTRRTSAAITWSGRSASTGAVLPSGTYQATITVRGGEGVARSVTKSIALSQKKLTPVSFSGTITAQNAYDLTVEGEYETGYESGSLALWSSPYLGDTVHTFSALLPSSFGNKYTNLKVYGCGYSYSDAATALLRLDADYNTYDGWALGNSEGCYGGSWSSSLVNGRSIYMAVGNVGQNYSYYYLLGFKVTGTKYVLK